MKPTEKRPVNEMERCRGHAHSINSLKQVPLVLICMYISENLPRMTTFVLHVIFSSANSDYETDRAPPRSHRAQWSLDP